MNPIQGQSECCPFGGVGHVWVKVCGIRTVRDALAAVAAGADAIGLVFAPESPRRVSPARAARIVRRLPPGVAAVGVVVNEPLARLAALVRQTSVSHLQLHGEESPADCRAARRRTRCPIIKAFRIGSVHDLAAIWRYRGAVAAVLLDAAGPGRRGGTGRTVDWRLARRARCLSTRVILAGGLRPDTVAVAIRRGQPDGVDVSSGVEHRPGVKDAQSVRAFVHEARMASRARGGPQVSRGTVVGWPPSRERRGLVVTSHRWDSSTRSSSC